MEYKSKYKAEEIEAILDAKNNTGEAVDANLDGLFVDALQTKEVELSESAEITPDEGFLGLKKVNVTVKGGGGGEEPKPVNDVTFYDYDGVVLYSYTKDEFLAMSEMPPLPTRKGLICQEWNWNYEDAIAYVSEYGVLDVGATYITDDGKTRLYISIVSNYERTIKLTLGQDVNNGIVIDWGDGTPTETYTGTWEISPTHKYTTIGDYCIEFEPVDGCTLEFRGLFPESQYNYPQHGLVKKVELGKNISLGNTSSNSAFKHLACKSINIPNYITTISDECFASTRINCIVFPRCCTSLGKYALSNCQSLVSPILSNRISSIPSSFINSLLALKRCVIPDTITTIKDYSFRECSSLYALLFPKSIMDISDNAFSYCYAIRVLDFSYHESIPTIGSKVFHTLTTTKIIVPDALYDEWIAATNWSALASRIIKKSDWDASQS